MAMSGLAVVLFMAALLAPRVSVTSARRPAPAMALLGVIAPVVQVGLVVMIGRLWGPQTEEYTGMPDLWVSIAMVLGVFSACFAASLWGLRLGQSLGGGAVALPAMALVQRLTTGWSGTSGGALISADASGTQAVLALALSALVLIAVLTLARRQAAVSMPVTVGTGALLLASALVIALLTIDVSPGTFPFAPLGRAVWVSAFATAALLAAICLSDREHPQRSLS